jgi:hypothetical protein
MNRSIDSHFRFSFLLLLALLELLTHCGDVGGGAFDTGVNTSLRNNLLKYIINVLFEAFALL